MDREILPGDIHVKDNMFNEVLGGVNEVVGEASNLIAEEFKGTNRFDKEPIPPETLEYVYDHMADQDIEYALERYGEDTLRRFSRDVNRYKQRRQAHAKW